jgi:hypothetical protein
MGKDVRVFEAVGMKGPWQKRIIRLAESPLASSSLASSSLASSSLASSMSSGPLPPVPSTNVTGATVSAREVLSVWGYPDDLFEAAGLNDAASLLQPLNYAMDWLSCTTGTDMAATTTSVTATHSRAPPDTLKAALEELPLVSRLRLRALMQRLDVSSVHSRWDEDAPACSWLQHFGFGCYVEAFVSSGYETVADLPATDDETLSGIFTDNADVDRFSAALVGLIAYQHSAGKVGVEASLLGESWDRLETPVVQAVVMPLSAPASAWLAHHSLQKYEELLCVEEGDGNTAEDLLAYVDDEETLVVMDANDRETFERELDLLSGNDGGS